MNLTLKEVRLAQLDRESFVYYCPNCKHVLLWHDDDYNLLFTGRREHEEKRKQAKRKVLIKTKGDTHD